MTSASAPTRGLAVDGASPIRTVPLPRWPVFDAEDARLASGVLLSGRVNYWTGSEGRAFEREFADWAGAAHAVAVANGTVALEISLRSAGIGPGDEVIVPAATFIATASAVVACGAVPVVVDVDPDSQALDATTVEPALTARTAGVVVVHVGGYPADAASLAALARDRGLVLIEDCAQAHGARRNGRPVGAQGHLAAWSFCQDKIMSTAGEGGAVTTSDEALARLCWSRKDHGKDYDAVHRADAPPGFRWVHYTFGTNARMTEIQAAIGRRQLSLLPEWVARRRANGERLRSALGDLPVLRLPHMPDEVEHAYYRFYGHLRTELLKPGWTRTRVVEAIQAEGIWCATGGCTEIHRERAFTSVGRPAGRLPIARSLGESSLVLPVHPALSDDDIIDVATAARRVLSEASV